MSQRYYTMVGTRLGEVSKSKEEILNKLAKTHPNLVKKLQKLDWQKILTHVAEESLKLTAKQLGLGLKENFQTLPAVRLEVKGKSFGVLFSNGLRTGFPQGVQLGFSIHEKSPTHTRKVISVCLLKSSTSDDHGMKNTGTKRTNAYMLTLVMISKMWVLNGSFGMKYNTTVNYFLADARRLYSFYGCGSSVGFERVEALAEAEFRVEVELLAQVELRVVRQQEIRALQ